MRYCANCLAPYESEINFCPYCGKKPSDAPQQDSIYLQAGSVLKDRYVLGKMLGSGAFGATYIAWDKQTERKVAVKEYLPVEFASRSLGQSAVSVFKDEKKQKQFHDGHVKFMEEADKLRKMPENGGMVSVYDHFNENKTAYLIMEYLEGETLAQRLEMGTIQASDAIHMLTPIVTSLQLAHSEGVIHGDICPSNIFLTTDGRVKLIDFSAHRLATTTHSRSLTVVVKSGYSPEEQYGSKGNQGPQTDVYSLGAVLYRMITGTIPPDALERRAWLERDKKDILKPIRAGRLTAGQAMAIMNALNVQVEDRTPDMATFFEELTSSSVKRRGNKISKLDFGKIPKVVKVAVVTSILLIGAAIAMLSLGVIRLGANLDNDMPEGMTRVPSVVSLKYDAAFEMLKTINLQCIIQGKEYSNTVPADYILLQDIAAGTITEINTILSLVISAGAEQKRVPQIVGLSENEAIELLEELGFAVKREVQFSQILEAGQVIKANVKADELYTVGETIILYVSKGPSENLGDYVAVVPDLTGLSFTELLEDDAFDFQGFQVEIVGREYSTNVPEGHILSQTLKAGERVMNSEKIGLIVSLGRHMSRVPDVQYVEKDTARVKLALEGLDVVVQQEESLTVAMGRVIRQHPAAGEIIDYGSSVTLVVSAGEPAFTVPDVVGISEKDARKELTDKGLTIAVSYENSSMVLENTVLRQTPSSGAEVRRGDKITITVCSGKPLVGIPTVVGKDKNTAKKSLENAGLVVTVNEIYSEYVKKDTVISQSPEGGVAQKEGTVVVLTVSLGREPVKVPSLFGFSQSYAESVLRELGLTSNATGEYSTTATLGNVISQTPAANTILSKGDMVYLQVSMGPKTDMLPDLTRLSRASAEATLYTMNLVSVIDESYSSTVPKGNVISQMPSVGTTVKEGDRVVLVISLGKEPISIKDVAGMTEKNAIRELQGQGFYVSVSRETHDSVPEGVVFSQSPIAGTRTEVGETVVITVSSGLPLVVVPNVVGQIEWIATDTLKEKKLSVSTRTEESRTVPIGTVISQSPSGGSSVKMNTTVTITVSEGIRIKDVIGATESSAKNTLQGQGLSVMVVTSPSNTVEIGKVISQSPSPGSAVNGGSAATITVSTGKVKVNVTSVVGMGEDSAASTLQGQGLTVERTYTESATVEAGKVIYQTPTAGTQVDTGTSVSITVSTGKAKVSIASVVGMDEDSAVSTLQGQRLTAERTYTESSTVEAGKVIYQTPTAGTQVDVGTSVSITVSTGKAKVNIASVVGMDEDSAVSTLQGQGLTVERTYTESATVEAGKVIYQTPSSSTQVDVGSVVTITISLGKAQSAVPDVMGLQEAEALSWMQDFMVTVKEADSQTVRYGLVTAQSLAAGTQADKGAAITITISSRKFTITNTLLSMTDWEAKTLLEDLGFSIELTQETSDTTEQNRIISIDIKNGGVVGSSLKNGDTINKGDHLLIRISTGADTSTE